MYLNWDCYGNCKYYLVEVTIEVDPCPQSFVVRAHLISSNVVVVSITNNLELLNSEYISIFVLDVGACFSWFPITSTLLNCDPFVVCSIVGTGHLVMVVL